MLRIGLLSFWHVHAKDYAKNAVDHPDTELVAAWDEDAARGRAECERRGLHFYERLDDLLAAPEIDGVIVTTPTTMHREVILAVARAGKHIFTEKVIAPTLHENNEIIAAANAAGVKLAVSLPRLYWGTTVAIREIVESGALGTLSYARMRVAHDGALPSADKPQGWLPEHFYDPATTAGGAMIDLGCHPMYLTRLFLGMPDAVSAVYGNVTQRAVEDNAVATLHYASGALGVVETGFVTPDWRGTIELHGTQGDVMFGTPDPVIRYRSQRATGGAWTTIETLPADQPLAFAQWVAHIQQNTTATENIAFATDLSALMEAANRAATQGVTVQLAALER